MIKLSIKNKKKSKKEYEGILDLQQKENGSVTLTMEDKVYPDHPWNVLTIKPDGTFKRAISLPHGIGLQVDNNGKILESEG